MWLGIRIETAGRGAVSFGYPGEGEREWLTGHHEQLVTTHSGCLQLFALLMTKHKLEQHKIMPTTLPTELINNFLEVCIGLFVLQIQNTEPLFS